MSCDFLMSVPPFFATGLSLYFLLLICGATCASCILETLFSCLGRDKMTTGALLRLIVSLGFTTVDITARHLASRLRASWVRFHRVHKDLSSDT